MRLEATIKQNIIGNRLENFSEIKENAQTVLKLVKVNFDQTPKIKVPISAYKQNVIDHLKKLASKLKRDS
jgi:hypothetical protein